MVNAVFGTIIAGEMVDIETSIVPAWAAIPVAIAVGVLIRRKVNLFAISLIGVTILYFTIYLGTIWPVETELRWDGVFLGPHGNWIVILFIYAGIASHAAGVAAAAAADYINGAQLVLGSACAVQRGFHRPARRKPRR